MLLLHSHRGPNTISIISQTEAIKSCRLYDEILNVPPGRNYNVE